MANEAARDPWLFPGRASRPLPYRETYEVETGVSAGPQLETYEASVPRDSTMDSADGAGYAGIGPDRLPRRDRSDSQDT